MSSTLKGSEMNLNVNTIDLEKLIVEGLKETPDYNRISVLHATLNPIINLCRYDLDLQDESEELQTFRDKLTKLMKDEK
jgi:hypothetical protein